MLMLLLSTSARAQAQAAPEAVPSVSTMTTPASSPDLKLPVDKLTPRQIEAMQKKLADWPGLGRYRDDNAKLGEPGAGEKRVVFYGDSITDGWGRSHGKFFPDMPWVNRGISGQTTPQMLVRFRQDVLDLQPEAVVILAGVNDIAGNTGPESLPAIENNFRSMVALAKQAHVRVVISSVLPATRIGWNPSADPHAEVQALNAWLQQFVAEQHLVYLNYFPALGDEHGDMRPGLSSDGVHPTDAGYAVMEPLARAAVAKALAQPRP
jgi:lysophospholipase L1-like esterase